MDNISIRTYYVLMIYEPCCLFTLFAGPVASITELTDFIAAAQMAKTESVFFEEEVFTLLDNVFLITLLNNGCGKMGRSSQFR